MNKTDFMGALLDSGMTPEDIYAFAQEQATEKIDTTKARKKLETVLGEYINTVAPWIKLEDIDFKEIESYLINLERALQSFKPVEKKSTTKSQNQEPKKKRIVMKR